MDLWLAILIFIIALALLIKGGDWFVSASSWVAKVTGISPIVIGATLVAFATAAPELLVSILASVKGANELAVGNALGSLACNLGIAFALITFFRSGLLHDRLFPAKASIMVLAMLLLLLGAFNGTIALIEASGLMLLFIVFTFINIRFGKADVIREKRVISRKEIIINMGKFLVGVTGLLIGANLMVDSGTSIARDLHVSEAVIGLTLVAIGTALPEIVTSITAIIKKEASLSLGNIIGANVIDATLILSFCSFTTGGNLPVEKNSYQIDIPVVLLLMLIAVIPPIIGRKTYRYQGVLLIAVYLSYTLFLFFQR